MLSTFADEVAAYKNQLAKSEDELGTPFVYIRVSKGAARVTTDRLGGTRRIVPTVTSRLELKGAVNFSLTSEQREMAGVKAGVECLIQTRKSNFQNPIDKVKDRFIVFGQEYRIEDFKSDVIAGTDIIMYNIGLISN